MEYQERLRAMSAKQYAGINTVSNALPQHPYLQVHALALLLPLTIALSLGLCWACQLDARAQEAKYFAANQQVQERSTRVYTIALIGHAPAEGLSPPHCRAPLGLPLCTRAKTQCTLSGDHAPMKIFA